MTNETRRNPNAVHDEGAVYSPLTISRDDYFVVAHVNHTYNELRPRIEALLTRCAENIGQANEVVDGVKVLRRKAPTGYHNINQTLGARLVGGVISDEVHQRIVLDVLPEYIANPEVCVAYFDEQGNTNYAFSRSKMCWLMLDVLREELTRVWGELGE